MKLALVTAAGLAVVAFAGVFQPSGAAAETTAGGLTVVGAGSSDVTPDRASFSFGTVSQGRTAAAAFAASAEEVTKVIAALRRAGVARADIQTSDVSISPRSSENGESIVGYTASNTVTAIVRKLDSAAGVIDAAVAAGANQMYGPNLIASDQSSAYNAALRAAVAEARAKAQTLASASGLTLGRITAVAESSASPGPMQTAVARDSAAPIEPGTQEIQATVSVTFAVS
jgi:uncharacterized protein YggE